MTVESTDTEAAAITESVVRHHLQAFLEQKGVAAIVSDYDDHACFLTEAAIHRGKQEIQRFFTAFLASLPDGAMDRFTLTSLQVAGNVAYITWCIGDDIPLGTDTFVVENGKLVSQTFAMHARTAPTPALS